MITGAFAIEFLDDVSAAAHKARRLLHQSFLTAFVLNVGLHQEPAHVGLSQLNRWMVEQLLDAGQGPRSG